MVKHGKRNQYMTRSLPEEVFPYLAIGLAKYVESEQKYPYPDELFYSLNQLSLAMLTTYPSTITGLFELFEKPLEQWWPGTLPQGIDPRFELLYEGTLDEQVVEFLLEYKLPAEATFQDIQVILDNQVMINILNVARNAYIGDPMGASKEYAAIRQYVITYPWSSNEQLRRQFRDLQHIRIQDVGALYQDSRSLHATLLYQRSDASEARYWNCPVCGPLYLRNNRLGSLKPNACLGRCPGPQGWQDLDPASHLLVLKRGIHLRTLIPGTTEIQLYQWLTQDGQSTTPALQQVILWPGVDRYDLQLKFLRSSQRVEAWAVDVKDYKDPFALGRHIGQDSRQASETALEWHRWFYVYPSYREQQRSDYRACVLRAAGQLPSNVGILSEKQFKALVAAQ
jgi:restriction endonuclease in pPIWI_RE module